MTAQKHEDLQHEVELTRQELSQTVDQLVQKMDFKPWLHTVREYQVPIALFTLALVLTFVGRKRSA